jgi:hypothetical protein
MLLWYKVVLLISFLMIGDVVLFAAETAFVNVNTKITPISIKNICFIIIITFFFYLII